jgi:hypothetical protein
MKWNLIYKFPINKFTLNAKLLNRPYEKFLKIQSHCKKTVLNGIKCAINHITNTLNLVLFILSLEHEFRT